MKINNYNKFIIESVFYDFILESKLVYLKDFRVIINELLTDNDSSVRKVARFIRDCDAQNMDVTQNYINTDKQSDKVSFFPDNKVTISDDIVSLTMNNNGQFGYIAGVHPLLFDVGIPKEGLNHTAEESEVPSNRWKILKKYNVKEYPDEFKKYNLDNYTLIHLQNIDDPSFYIVSLDNSTSKEFGTHPAFDLPDNLRGSIKTGRFVNRLLDIWFKDKSGRELYKAADIEKFVNAYTAKALFNANINDNFKIVSGEDIRKWYNVNTYAHEDAGQLGSSCMRYDVCQKYFDIYVNNPDVCNLLILTHNDKLLGRAIIWTDINGGKYMDRIYTYRDSYDNIFKNWGVENKYKYIYGNSSDVTIKVKNIEYKYFPYMDTFEYFKPEDDGDAFLYNRRPERPYYILQETNGSKTTHL